MAFVPGYKHDIFISYTREDDQPHSGIAQGWVSTLVKDLKEMLALKLGPKEFSLWIEDEFGYQGINYLPNEERLRYKIAELQEQWDLFSKRLSRLERARIQETRVDEKMRLEDQINDTKAEREQVEQELSSLENQLIQKAGNEADAVEAGTVDKVSKLKATAIFIVILSRTYIASDWCQKRKNSFLDIVQKRGSQVFVIETDRLEKEKCPSEFANAQHYRFWTIDRDERLLRISGNPRPCPDEYKYYDLLNELSHNLANELQRLQVSPDSIDRERLLESEILATVFLADVTDDLYFVREDVKRYLIQANIRVLPESNYSLEPNAFQKVVCEDLAKSDLFVQLLSAFPGKKPSDLPKDYVHYQYDMAFMALEANKPVLQWRAPELNIDEIQDAEYRDFLRHRTVRADIGIEGLKGEITRKIKELKKPASSTTDTTRGKLIFIDADVNDSLLCDRICRLLEAEQIEYVKFDPPRQETSVREAFEGWIIDCDALIVMYGQVDFSWFNQVFRNVRHVAWKRAQQPLSAYVVCDPSPEQKQILRMKIRGLKTLEYGSCSDEQKLREFINSL